MKSFSEMTETDSGTLMIVDTLNLGFRYLHRNVSNFMSDYTKTVDSLKKSFKAGKVVLTGDMGSSSYRKQILPEYKANRKEKYESQTDEEKEKFAAFFEEMSAILEGYRDSGNYPVLAFPNVEADDIAAYLVLRRKKFGIDKIKLISSDKDWDLLINENVERFCYITKKDVTVDSWDSYYEFTPEEFISIKCLTGDKGDNVPGVPGIGDKKALALVKQYGSAFEIAASLPISSKYKYIAALNNFGSENLLRNYKLMDLVTYSEDAIGPDNCKQIDKVMMEYMNV